MYFGMYTGDHKNAQVVAGLRELFKGDRVLIAGATEADAWVGATVAKVPSTTVIAKDPMAGVYTVVTDGGRKVEGLKRDEVKLPDGRVGELFDPHASSPTAGLDGDADPVLG